MTTDITLETTLAHCLSQQLYEIELLKSMYPKKDDIIFTDSETIKHVTDFVNNEDKTAFVPNHIDFILNIYVDKHKLEISVNLPSFYPNDEPDLYIRCNQLNRQEETALNTQLSMFLKTEKQEGEVCIYNAISWVQENIDKFSKLNIISECKKVKDEKLQGNEKFCRQWIHSHHIYNKRKREEIVNIAREFKLTGFCLPGKPGIVCIEGDEDDCKEWWKIIKSMNWKKIVIRKTDIFEQYEKNQQQKFQNFEEIHFQSTSKNSKHADMSEFSKYIEKYGLGSDFNDFFGLCNEP